MTTEQLTSLPIIAGVAVALILLLLLGLFRLKRSINTLSNHHRQQSRALDKELQKANKQLLEVRSVVVGLGQKLSEQQEIIRYQNERLNELENADSDGRLYSRASKMVKLGAGINELIEECELPKAEAELMMSLQKKLAGKETIPPLEGSPERSSKQPPRRTARK